MGNLICDFNMAWYPFDKQVCALELYQPEDLIKVNPTDLVYSGPKELAQHYVTHTVFCPKSIKGKSGVVAEVHFGRPLFGSILTIYIPTSTFLILCQMVGIFKEDYLDMVIGVNITLLLVFATFFLSITASLPLTAYIKMVDIWMILMMLYPFLTVSLLTCKELVQNSQKIAGKPSKTSSAGRVANNPEVFLPISDESRILKFICFLLDKGLLIFITIFALIYWTCGLVSNRNGKISGGC